MVNIVPKKITEATDTIQGNSQVSRREASVNADVTTSSARSQADIENIPLSERFNENNPDIRFSFAGESSEFADSTALDTAKQMLADGVNSEKIRKQTGWFKSYDGKWRYEIDDSKMHINSMEYRNGGNYTTVGRLIEHSDLFDAYPFLTDMPLFFVDIGNDKGTYSQTFGMIKLDRSLKNNIDGFRRVVIHELQHAINAFMIQSTAIAFLRNQYGQAMHS